MGFMETPDDREATMIAASTMHTFNNVIAMLHPAQQIIATKALLRYARDLLEKLESKPFKNVNI